jgi:hypothetical protein
VYYQTENGKWGRGMGVVLFSTVFMVFKMRFVNAWSASSFEGLHELWMVFS